MNVREYRLQNFQETIRILLLRRNDPHDAELAEATGSEGGLPRKETWLWHKIVEAAERELFPPRVPVLNDQAVQQSAEPWTMSPPRVREFDHAEWSQECFDFLAAEIDSNDPRP